VFYLVKLWVRVAGAYELNHECAFVYTWTEYCYRTDMGRYRNAWVCSSPMNH